MAQIQPDPVNPNQNISMEQVHSPSDFEDDAALQLVVQDARNTEAWLQNNYWSLRWREADALYQALALDTPVMTANGLQPIEAVHPGDYVFGKDGRLHKVIGESPVFLNRECYEITFSTGEKVTADACHLWETTACIGGMGTGHNSGSLKKGEYTAIRNTKTLADTCYYGNYRFNHRIPVTPALDTPFAELPIDPYTLGVWLGDGDRTSPRITSMDEEVVYQMELAEGVSAKKYSSKNQSVYGNKASRYAFTGYAKKEDSLQTRLKKLGVWNNKHIPESYFLASREQRTDLLRGLLDTDGSCSLEGNVTFRSTNFFLARGVKRLACSLGWRASIKEYEADRYSDGKFYSVHFTPCADKKLFHIGRKASRQADKKNNQWRRNRSIISVERVPSVPVKCISVEGEFYLITDGLIATHNSPPGVLMWEGTTVPRANVNRFVVAETVNSIHPQIMNGLFYEEPAFVLRPRPNRSQETTRAITELLAIQLEEMRFKEEVDWGLFTGILFGTAIWKWGFKTQVKKTYKFIRPEPPLISLPGQDPVQIETDEDTIWQKKPIEEVIFTPTFENKDIRHVLVSPGCRWPDISRANFVIDRMYMTYRDLVALKDEKYRDEKGKIKNRYNLPSEEEIKSWFEPPIQHPQQPGATEGIVQPSTWIHHAKPRFEKTTEDPLDEPLEVLERWDNDKVITVLNGVKVIRNEPNELGCIPFLSVNWWNIPDAFWGMGLGRIIGVEQRVQAGLINACIDLANLIVNPMFVRAKGSNAQTQQIRQRIGGIIDVEVGGATGARSVKDALGILEQPHIPAEIINQITLSEMRVEKTSGANAQLTMGAAPIGGRGASLGRSGTGAAGIIQATMNRLGGYAEMFVRQVYRPLLYKMHELNRERLPVSYIRRLLGEKLGKEFADAFDPLEYKNAAVDFEVLAGSHLAQKQQMYQSLMLIMQIFEAPGITDTLGSVQHKKVNLEELLKMVFDLSGWKNYYDVVQDMTPEEAARQDQQTSLLQQKAQIQSALSDQNFQQKRVVVDQENEARLARDVIKGILKHGVGEQLAAPETPETPETPEIPEA